MKFGLHLPNFGAFGDAGVLADLAVQAESAGWDGFFLWDHLLFCEFDKNAHVDPWVALTAVAAATSTIMIGPLVTPLARRRPWELARQTVSLQNFSKGRLILGVGLGEPTEWDFRFFGDSDRSPHPRREARRGSGDPEGPVVGRAVRVPGHALHPRADDVPARSRHPGADLGRRRLAESPAVPASRSLPGGHAARRRGRWHRGAPAGRGLRPRPPRDRTSRSTSW